MEHRGKVWKDETMNAENISGQYASYHMIFHMPMSVFHPSATQFKNQKTGCPVAETFHILLSVFLEIGRRLISQKM